ARKHGHLRFEERHQAEELPPEPGVAVEPAGVRIGGGLGRLAPERVEHYGMRRPRWKVAAGREDRKRGTRLRHRQAPYANIRGHGEMRGRMRRFARSIERITIRSCARRAHFSRIASASSCPRKASRAVLLSGW